MGFFTHKILIFNFLNIIVAHIFTYSFRGITMSSLNTILISNISFIAVGIFMYLSSKIWMYCISKPDDDIIRIYGSLGLDIALKFLVLLSIWAFFIDNAYDYAVKVNRDFIESGKTIYTEKEAVENKIIDTDLKNSYFVSRGIDNIQMSFNGNTLKTTFKDISCNDFLNQVEDLVKLKNVKHITVNGTPLTYILQSDANKKYECAKNQTDVFILQSQI